MRILADENMPYVQELFSAHADVIQVPGRDIQAEMLTDVDALLVRSVTQVNGALLSQANRLKFIGSATIGTDHVDQHLLAERGIVFSNAPGCNANAVCDYVLSSLLLMAERREIKVAGLVAGIVGVGNIGTRLIPRLEALGMTVLCCDPLRAEVEADFEHVAFEALLSQCDLLTFHVPHTQGGAYPTFHMLAKRELQQLKADCILINACRGEVIDNFALKTHLKQGGCQSVVLDVWEHEPNPDPELINLVDIATPHIAGYSQEGKALGTSMVYDAWAKLNQRPKSELSQLLPQPDLSAMTVSSEPGQELLKQLIQAVYDVRDDDERMRRQLHQPGYFDAMRKHYPLRRELRSTQLMLHSTLTDKTGQQMARIGFLCNHSTNQ